MTTKEQLSVYDRKSYLKHRKERLEHDRLYNSLNKERISNRRKELRLLNHEAVLSKERLRRKRRLPELAAKQRLRNRTMREAFNCLLRQAKLSGRKVLLDFCEYVKIIIIGKCYYCGQQLNPAGSGLDRIDSTKNYEISNVRPCCKMCNIAKHNYTEKEFKDWVRNIFINWAGK